MAVFAEDQNFDEKMHMTTTLLAGEVRAIVMLIPPGTVATYGDIAQMLDVGPRQVGRAMGMLDDDIPWYRVVNANGTPASCHDGQARGLLGAEATPMIGSRVDMRLARWDFHSRSMLEVADG